MQDDVVILIAEDDLGHFLLAKRQLRGLGLSQNIIHFPDGQLATNYLNDNCIVDDGTKYLLLLDIRMPKINGVEILDYVKKHPELKRIPVVIVTTSDNPINVNRCKSLGCEDYIVKPLDDTLVDRLSNVIETVFPIESC
jgi:CheY-like chemotaxis protein